MAKIPIILEPGRADGKLVASSSIFDENKNKFQNKINQEVENRLNDVKDTLNSDSTISPLSAKQGKILKNLLDSKVVEKGSIPIDSEPILGNITHIVNSDGLAKEFNKCNTTIINTNRIANEAIVHSKLSTDIQSLISNLSKTATFAGIATPTINPGTPDGSVFYIATQAGIYSNFNGIEVAEGEVVILYYDTTWHKDKTGIASEKKLSELDLISFSIGEGIKITDITVGSYISDDGKTIITDAARAYCERYIKVEKDKIYAINKKGYIPCIFIYDDSYNLISYKWFHLFENDYLFVPSVNGYVRISLWTIDKTSPFSITDYIPVEIICYDSVIYNQKYINEKIYDVTGGVCVIDERDIDMNVYIDNRGNKQQDIARCHSHYIPVVAECTYGLDNGGYKILISFFDKDKKFIGYNHWFDIGINNFVTPSNCSYVIINFATADSSLMKSFGGASIFKEGEIKGIKQDIDNVKAKTDGIGRAFIKSGFYIYHNFVGSIQGIPSQSLKDIAFAAKTNADMIEANIHKCSDGEYVCLHGDKGTLGSVLNFGNSGYTPSTPFVDVSSTILRQEVTYAGNDPQNSRMHIPTLDEFCMECRRHNIAVSLSTSESSYLEDALRIARKYLSDDKIVIGLYGNSFVRGNFKGLIADYYDFLSKEDIVARAKSIGLPYLYCCKNYDSIDKDTIKETVEYLHENGILVSGAYDTPTSIIRRQNEGFDAVSPTTTAIKPFDYGGLMDFFDTSANITYMEGATYSSLNNETTMPKGSRLFIYKSEYNNFYIGVSLKIKYNGKLTIYNGLGVSASSPSYYYALNSFESNGDTYITFAQTNNYGMGGNMLVIIADEDTTIYSMEFHAKRLM